MGAAARKIADSGHMPTARGHLRLVPDATTTTRRRAASRRRGSSKEIFRICCAAMLVLACMGMVRIGLAVQAEEAAIDAVSLREDIRSEELMGKSLEADASALKALSRIEAIAGSALNMAKAEKVTYLDIPSGGKSDVPSAVRSSRSAASGMTGVVSRVMDLAAGEAQVLLVGDVGLSSR